MGQLYRRLLTGRFQDRILVAEPGVAPAAVQIRRRASIGEGAPEFAFYSVRGCSANEPGVMAPAGS
jgi:hypothetical protein